MRLTVEQETLLDAYAALMSRVERKLFAEISAGKNLNILKTRFLSQFGITARQFNSCRVQLEGKIASIKELRKIQIVENETRIAELEKKIQKLEKQKASPNQIHQKKRRLFSLKCKLHNQKSDDNSGKVRLCFGSKKLYVYYTLS